MIWPGGCFADEYHWTDGIGPKDKRPTMQNNNWGGTIEDNSFGTHEFLNLCEMLGCEPYISGNVGSGTVEELAKWVEYMTSDGNTPMAKLRRQNGRDKAWKVKFLGVGNESWGCGGSMRPEYYGDLYRRYSTYCRNYDGTNLITASLNCDSPLTTNLIRNYTDINADFFGKIQLKGKILDTYKTVADFRSALAAKDSATIALYADSLNQNVKFDLYYDNIDTKVADNKLYVGTIGSDYYMLLPEVKFAGQSDYVPFVQRLTLKEIGGVFELYKSFNRDVIFGLFGLIQQLKTSASL